MIGKYIRRFAFWTLDSLKGGIIKKNYQFAKDIDLSSRTNTDALDEILSYASEHIPAYRGIKYRSLSDFPVVSKAIYRENYEAYMSDEYRDTEKLHEVRTSGSTGQPFRAYQNKEKIWMHQATILYLNDKIGWNQGERYLFLRVWGMNHKLSRFSEYKNNCVPYNVLNFTEERMEKLKKLIIADSSLHIIVGYASAIIVFAEYLEHCGVSSEKLNIRLVVITADGISEESRLKIHRVFGCPVINRYGNEENGIIAITLPEDNRMHINRTEFFAEILKTDCDEPAEIGEVGRIVITDLYNKAFPFIRYDTGDLGTADETVNGCCSVLRTLDGRSAASLRSTDGRMLTETVVNAHFSCVRGIGRFQIIQTGKKSYLMKVENTPVALDSVLSEKCRQCFGSDADIIFEHVSAVQLGKNGKYRVTINELAQ